MSICKYCGKPAGFLTKKHFECENVHSDGLNNIRDLIFAYLKNDQPIESIESRIFIIEENSYITLNESLIKIIDSIKFRLKTILNSEVFNDSEIRKIFLLKKFLSDKYKNVINEELIKENFSENQLITYEGKKAIVIKATETSILLKELEGKMKVMNKKDNIEFLFNKYSDSLFNELKDYLFDKIATFSFELMNQNTDPLLLKEQLIKKLQSYEFTDNQLKNIILKSIETLIEKSLEENIIDKTRENYIVSLKKYFSLGQQELDSNGCYTKLAKSLVLRDIFEDRLPKRCNVTNKLPFNLQKNESLIWLINDVKYYEVKEKREYIGGHHGLSIRVAKGLYYRAGAFKGKPISTETKEYISAGILAFTTKHIYFHSYKAGFRIRYDKIVSVAPNSDGFTILKDGVTARQQTFVDGDGWFSYNLITNLSQADLKVV